MRFAAKGLLGFAGALMLAGSPLHAASTIDTKAQAALTAMQTLNVVVLGNWSVGNSGDVEGKAYVGGNISGSKLTVGYGNSSQKATSSTWSTLNVGGNMTNGASISNGSNSNGTMGGYGLTVIGAASGGDITFNNDSSTTNINKGFTSGTLTTGASSKVNINSGGATGLSLGTSSDAKVGGNIQSLTTVSGTSADLTTVVATGKLGGGNMNLNGDNLAIQAASYQGSTNGLGTNSTAKISGSNPNGGSPGTGWSFGVSQTLNAPAAAALATSTATMTANMQDLASQLSSLSANNSFTTVNGQDTLFTVSNTNAGYAVFNITAAQLFSSRNIAFDTNGSTLPIIVNITGLAAGQTYNFTSNSLGNYNNSGSAWDSTLNSQIIWNLGTTAGTTLNVSSILHGSVLDAYGTVANSTPIEGSVVANIFNQNGEVHLGTFDGGDSSTASIVKLATVSAVPETSAWIMMIFGFGIVGRMIRKQKPQLLPVFA